MQDVLEGKHYNFPKQEERVLQLWQDIDAFKEQLRRTEGKKPYVFYDGPPFATGLPHYGHLLAGTLKDIVTRYATATGHYCPRRFGWDCHGLPVEFEIDKKLGISTKDDVLKMGIDKYNEECRSIVMRYSKEWVKTVQRLGRWIDFENGYKTLDPTFMESVWWVFKQLHSKGLVYQGFKVMPYSTGCSTPLSNFEAGLNYKDVPDPAIKVSFPLDNDADQAHLVIWTTTPWTLPSNLAVCVHPDFDYVKVRDPATQRVYIVAEARLAELPGAVPKAAKGKKKEAEKPQGGFEVLAKMKGRDLAGRTYQPLFPYFLRLKQPDGAMKGAFRVLTDEYVTADAGTGIVHQAPAFGEDDYRVCRHHGVTVAGGELPCPVDASGRFTKEVSHFAGQYVKDADKAIIKHIKKAGRLVDNQTFVHSYPFCWRSDTPLIYRAVPSWFVEVTKIKDRLIANNEQTYWVPAYVREKRFKNWLAEARDWAVSRSRFWGTPLPVWMSDDGEEMVIVGSVAELEELTGEKVTDLHRHFIDHLTIPSRQGKGQLKRVQDVFDCWFESGSMPYGQLHYPFENKDFFEANFPADFVAEGIDQTRGWFYTLMVLSTALFDKPAFKSLVCNGLVLAEDGKKMSKRLKNYPDPMEVINEHGADALRLYLINSPVVRGETLKFSKAGVFAVIKDVFLPWYNAYRFLVQNALRLKQEAGIDFDPAKVDVNQATNVLDCWVSAAARSLTIFVAQEMAAYKVYTVVPMLVKFIESLTNIYVRYNRRRLKGAKGVDDTLMALGTLFDVLLKVCKVMAPFTPFFTEMMYQNLRRCLPPSAPQSVHWCDFPEAQAAHAGDQHIQQSVERMQSVIEHVRLIREKHNKPLKQPLKELTVVHTDESFLADISGKLRDYVLEEGNVRDLKTCSDPERYCSTRAEPVFSALGQRLGKDMGPVGKAIKALGPAQLDQLKQQGYLDVQGQRVEEAEIKVVQDFQQPEGTSKEEMDAAGDGEVLVVLDLRSNDSLVEEGMAREIINRVQKLRKNAGLVATDSVDIYLQPLTNGRNGLLQHVITSQADYAAKVLGRPVQDAAHLPPHAVVIARQREPGIASGGQASCSFELVLTQPAVVADQQGLLEACDGDQELAEGAGIWLASRDLAALQKEVQSDGGFVAVRLNGKLLRLKEGGHFRLPARRTAPSS
eukprot:jgi/Astpho2/9063/e_gw1.00133.6.1_t